MKSANASIIAGIVLISAGVLLLLDLLDVIESAAYVPMLIFAAIGAVFLSVFIRSPENWEAAITAARPRNTEPGIAAHQFSGLRMKRDRNTAPMAAKISIGT